MTALHDIIIYCTQESFGGGKLVNLAFELFATHQYSQNVFGIYNDYSSFAKFFLVSGLYLYGSPKFSPAKYFLCTVYYSIDIIIMASLVLIEIMLL